VRRTFRIKALETWPATVTYYIVADSEADAVAQVQTLTCKPVKHDHSHKGDKLMAILSTEEVKRATD
jgi:hypothetical protein